jgi:menaquinone-dependent protoporphyrinogen oxidase
MTNNSAIKWLNVPCLIIIAVFSFATLMSTVAHCQADEAKVSGKTYGENKSMSPKILVAYSSRTGSTAEVADAIGKKLAQGGTTVDVMSVKDVRSLNGYRAVVLGSAIRADKILPEISSFVKANKNELQKVPVAYFIVCMTLREDTPEKRKKADAYLDPLRAEIKPVDAGLFAGKMDYSKLSFIEKLIIKNIVKVTEGDFRNWPEINGWAETLRPKLMAK